MIALTLDQLRADLGRIHAHGLTATNVLVVQHDASGAVTIEIDTGARDEDLEEAKKAEARLEKELKEIEAERDRLDKENQKLATMHEEFADKESGVTPLTYLKQAGDALQRCKNYERAMNEARVERDALRTRKGIACELFKNSREVLDFIHLCSRGEMQPAACRQHAAELVAKLYPKA